MHLRRGGSVRGGNIAAAKCGGGGQPRAPESCVPGMRILCSGRCHKAATSWPIQFAASRRVTSHTGGRLTAAAAALQLASSAVAHSCEAAAPSSPDASAQARGRVTPGFAPAAFASLGAPPSSWGASSTASNARAASASSPLDSDASPEAAAADSEAAPPGSCCASPLDVRRERLRLELSGVATCVTPRSAGSMCLEIPSSRARARFMLPSRATARQRVTAAGAGLWRLMDADIGGTQRLNRAGRRSVWAAATRSAS